ncbi:MFS transporter [Actinocatenispora rupis]|uniref:MFS transporter n=1 Tax=Actinocatenispora rupis TaxID=519421 RepID=A0A8J3N9F5_9ACTN|nr:MFS transporter [Actinocatenispora rupis]GID11061.1 MFS transporter [Actinocatenispora rupis]
MTDVRAAVAGHAAADVRLPGVRRGLALAASVAGAMLVALDGTILLVAQPRLRTELGAGLSAVQWTSTGYLVAVAALLVVAGRLGDRYGHVRLLATGALGFAAASAGIALAPGIGVVVALRVAQGVFGALLQPATLALLRLAYPADRLGRPVAVRTAAIGVASAAGPVLGGALVAHLGWRAVFVLSAPVAVAVAALALAVRLPAPRRTGARLDLVGAALVAGTLAAGVHTLVGIPAYGWASARTLAGLAGTAAAAVLLTWHERRTADPIVPRPVLRSATVTAATAILLLTTAALLGTLFVGTYLLQDRLGLDALTAGLRVLPLTLLMVAGAPVANTALRRYGARRTAAVGVVLVAAGVTALSWTIAAPYVAGVTFGMLGAGFAAVMVTATAAVVGDAPPGYAGVVGGLKQTAMNIGPTLGIAVAATLGTGGPATLPALAAIAALALVPVLRLPRHSTVDG